jgi:hypothetical protein
VGFAIVCPSCASMTDAELGRRLVAEHADVLLQAAETPFRRPAILGLCIGETGSLPRRHVLVECEDCRAMLWVDADETDRMAPETPLHLCRGCALKRLEAGQMEAVPIFVVGGLS